MKRVYYDNAAYYREYKKLPQSDGVHCVICGIMLPKRKRRYCTDECFSKWYHEISGILDWASTRAEFLKKHPSCARCRSLNNLEVDHIMPIFKGGKEFDMNNLQTLCHKCHAGKTRQDRKSMKIIDMKLLFPKEKQLHTFMTQR